MGCQEMKEKKKEPLNKTEKEKDKEKENDNKVENKDDDNDEKIKEIKEEKIEVKNSYKNEEEEDDKKSTPLINMAQIEEHPIKSEINQMIYPDIDRNDKEDEKIESILKIDEEPYIPNYLGKLCFEPLDLFIYDTKKKSFHVQKYRNEENSVLEKLTSSSSCCNGDNKLFVSGGIDFNDEIIDKLWIFDLINYNIECIHNFAAKNNHSMIYIPNKYIFLVGGNNEKVLYFDINEKMIESWSDLNKRRLEPALIQINNYLYVFDNVNKNENNFELNFERTNLLSDKPNFELIEPNLDENIQGNIIPKFFGVSKESEDSIIFLGGNILDEQNDENNDIKTYSYDIKENKIKFSNVPFVNIQLKEKTFFKFNNRDDIYFILSDFYKKCPKVVFYIKSQNKVKIIDYKPEINKGINEQQNNIILRGPKQHLKLKSYNFNMPKNNENISDNIIHNE